MRTWKAQNDFNVPPSISSYSRLRIFWTVSSLEIHSFIKITLLEFKSVMELKFEIARVLGRLPMFSRTRPVSSVATAKGRKLVKSSSCFSKNGFLSNKLVSNIKIKILTVEFLTARVNSFI